MPAVEERLVSLDASMEAILELRTEIRELRADMNRRFDQTERRLERLEEKVDKQFLWVIGILMTFFIALITTLMRAA